MPLIGLLIVYVVFAWLLGFWPFEEGFFTGPTSECSYDAGYDDGYDGALPKCSIEAYLVSEHGRSISGHSESDILYWSVFRTIENLVRLTNVCTICAADWPFGVVQPATASRACHRSAFAIVIDARASALVTPWFGPSGVRQGSVRHPAAVEGTATGGQRNGYTDCQ